MTSSAIPPAMPSQCRVPTLTKMPIVKTRSQKLDGPASWTPTGHKEARAVEAHPCRLRELSFTSPGERVTAQRLDALSVRLYCPQESGLPSPLPTIPASCQLAMPYM